MLKECIGSQPLLIAWQRSQAGSYILNVDDNAQTNSGMAGWMADFGGLIRDSNDKFMYGFYTKLVTRIFFMQKFWF